MRFNLHEEALCRFGIINILQLTNYEEQKQDIKEPVETSKYSAVSPASTFFHILIPETRVSTGDVKTVFIGHDHKNDLCGNLDGIWFCYGGGLGYHAYGVVGWPRRARVILDGVEKIKKWKRLNDGMMGKSFGRDDNNKHTY
ncbi:Hypothetical predicted protein [Olea europaea subsp. europaea]|uniref:Uncharacterized protein n=1 Tax=Olea europaea subsp. europaea TaxID=158383 RepID=A0A8S0R7J3_OLEEU|nr:Hypothetical predicted protein [Olea europaea subsp. europaea]